MKRVLTAVALATMAAFSLAADTQDATRAELARERRRLDAARRHLEAPRDGAVAARERQPSGCRRGRTSGRGSGRDDSPRGVGVGGRTGRPVSARETSSDRRPGRGPQAVDRADRGRARDPENIGRHLRQVDGDHRAGRATRSLPNGSRGNDRLGRVHPRGRIRGIAAGNSRQRSAARREGGLQARFHGRLHWPRGPRQQHDRRNLGGNDLRDRRTGLRSLDGGSRKGRERMTAQRGSWARLAVPVALGVLLGFIGGYFAGGGGRPSAPASKMSAQGGGRLEEVRGALDKDPENPKLLAELGNLYYDGDDWDRAIAAYEKARRKAPKDPNLLSDLGSAYRNRGEFKMAESFFNRAREADPDHWQ